MRDEIRGETSGADHGFIVRIASSFTSLCPRKVGAGGTAAH